jgi:hypothetical protein
VKKPTQLRGFKNLLLAGSVVGFAFGIVDLIWTFFYPLEDDTPGQLLLFYGPMFLLWIVVSFRATRRTGRFSSGVVAGMGVAFATFCVFVVFNFLRVNLFLNQLAERADWQNMMMRFRTSGSESLRLFVNLDYIKGTPLKILVATAIGTAMGAFGGLLGWLSRERRLGHG